MRRGEGEKLPDIVWLKTDGTDNAAGGLGQRLRPDHRRVPQRDGIQEQDSRGRRITDVNFVLYFNAHDDDVEFTLPADEYAPSWDVIIDTADQADTEEPLKAGSVLKRGTPSPWWCSAPTSGPEVEVDHSVAASLAVHGRARGQPIEDNGRRPRNEAAEAVEKAAAK